MCRLKNRSTRSDCGWCVSWIHKLIGESPVCEIKRPLNFIRPLPRLQNPTWMGRTEKKPCKRKVTDDYASNDFRMGEKSVFRGPW